LPPFLSLNTAIKMIGEVDMLLDMRHRFINHWIQRAGQYDVIDDSGFRFKTPDPNGCIRIAKKQVSRKGELLVANKLEFFQVGGNILLEFDSTSLIYARKKMFYQFQVERIQLFTTGHSIK